MSLENLNNADKVKELMEKSLGKIEGRVDGIEKALESLNETLNGNGREGLKQTIIRLEERQKNMDDAAKMRGEKLDGLISTSNENNELLKSHLGDKSLHNISGLVRNMSWKLFLGMFGFFILFHIFLTAIIPPGTDIWELIIKVVF